MEDALGVVGDQGSERIIHGLNPCFNGRCTRRHMFRNECFSLLVLILVLMEDALGAVHSLATHNLYNSLNPCFNGRCTRSSIPQTER